MPSTGQGTIRACRGKGCPAGTTRPPVQEGARRSLPAPRAADEAFIAQQGGQPSRTAKDRPCQPGGSPVPGPGTYRAAPPAAARRDCPPCATATRGPVPTAPVPNPSRKAANALGPRNTEENTQYAPSRKMGCYSHSCTTFSTKSLQSVLP